MSSNQKRGFRLPWGTDRGPAGGAATLDPAEDQADGAERDDLGKGPFQLAGAAQTSSTDAAPAAADAPDPDPEAVMIDAEAPAPDTVAAETAQHDAPADPPDGAGDDAPAAGWPDADRRDPDARPPIHALSGSALPRRDNPLVAGLVKAMREAAVASRAETSARLEAEANGRVEAIRARATGEAAALKRQADEDVAGIREWSKAEIARVRQETEDRIEARRVELAAETERHAGVVERLITEVQTTVAAFEADMDRFFTDLLAESDPARLATLAERAPDPPDLRGDGPAATDLDAVTAAEAEAEASEGLDPSAAEAWPTATRSGSRAAEAPVEPVDANGPDSTRLLVRGLTSVAGISAFKGALGQLSGVRSVSVSSGAAGVFVFTVAHDPGVDLDSGVTTLTGFSARVTDATDDGFTVDAQEPS